MILEHPKGNNGNYVNQSANIIGPWWHYAVAANLVESNHTAWRHQGITLTSADSFITVTS